MVPLNKPEAYLALLSITLCGSVQYLFYQSIPPSITVFAFMTVTNALGLLMLCLVFRGELRNLNLSVFAKGFILAVLSIIFNTLLIMGSQILYASMAAFTGSLFIIFVPLFLLIAYRERPAKENVVAIVFILFGLGLATRFNISEILQPGVIFIIISDIFFAFYIIVLGRFAKTSPPGYLAVTRILFSTVIFFVIWCFVQPQTLFSMNITPELWGSILVIGLFLCGYSIVMQIYVQRYTSPMTVSMIFSTEIVFTVLFSMFLPVILGKNPTFPGIGEILGCAVIVFGVMLSNFKLPDNMVNIGRLLEKSFKSPHKTVPSGEKAVIHPQHVSEKFFMIFRERQFYLLLILGIIVYTVLNTCFRPVFTVLPIAGPCVICAFIMGLYFGAPGIISVVLGGLLSDILGGTLGYLSIFTAVANAVFTGGIYFLWYAGKGRGRPSMKNIGDFGRICLYCLISGAAAALIVMAGQLLLNQNGEFSAVFLSLFFYGIFFGLPIGSLMTSVFGITAISPGKAAPPEKSLFYQSIPSRLDAVGYLCEHLTEHCEKENISFKRSYNAVLAVEEMLVNIIENAYPNGDSGKIEIRVNTQEIITIRIEHTGDYFNAVNFQKKNKPEKISLKQLFSDTSPDNLGILMVTQMAVKVEHKWKRGLNTLTIIM